MAEQSSLPQTIASDTSPLCVNESQQPTLTLSPPLPSIPEKTPFLEQQQQPLTRSPKKPKPSPLPQIERIEFAGPELDGNKPDSEKQSVEFEVEKRNSNFVESGSIIERGIELNDRVRSCVHGSTNQSVANEVVQFDEGNEIAGCELEKLSADCESDSVKRFQSVEFELEKRNGDFNQVVGSSEQGSLINQSLTNEVGEKTSETRVRNGDSSLVGVSNGEDRKLVYSRKELEGLRFVNGKAQKKFWQRIRNGLEKAVKKEYEELGSSKKQQKNGNRRQNDEMRNCSAQGVEGQLSLEDVSCDAVIKSSVHLSCDASNNEDCNDPVEEWSEEEESEDEYESIQRPAFLVEGEPDFESGPPEDGLEYLRRVRWEAAHIPKVKVAKIDYTKLKKEQSIYMPKIPEIEKCPPHLAPSKQWEDEFISDFSELRVAISRLDDASDTTLSDPQSIIFSPIDHKSHTSNSRAALELPKGGPTLSAVLDMEPATRVAMLKKRISLFVNGSNMSKDDCAWLFALCAAVDTPLDADTCASLRCLLRRCAKLRAEKMELDDEVVMLNVLATISGKFFRQSEN